MFYSYFHRSIDASNYPESIGGSDCDISSTLCILTCLVNILQPAGGPPIIPSFNTTHTKYDKIIDAHISIAAPITIVVSFIVTYDVSNLCCLLRVHRDVYYMQYFWLPNVFFIYAMPFNNLY